VNRRATLAVALSVTLAAGLTACTRSTPTLSAIPTQSPGPSQTDAAYGPGADGIGDAYFPTAGNGGYDVGDYDLNVLYDPVSKQLTGVATITATATANLTSFDLDFTGLTTSSITVNGAPAKADQHDNAELVVTPATPLASGTTFITVVSYGGQPQGYNDPQLGHVGFMTTSDGAVAVGEPEVAASWFPVNDHPRDKATYTIHISAPSDLAALSNGLLVSKQAATRSGFTTWTWRESSPMASYLATMVVGHYRLHESTTSSGLPVVTAVHTSLPTSIDDELARTPEIIDFESTVFGPYPFDAEGGIVVQPIIGFALENQTRPVYSAGFFIGGGDQTWVIAHELAHQWYGDSVSVHDWSEIWLNEGFATYAEWLWEEHIGVRPAQLEFVNTYNRQPDSFWLQPAGSPPKDQLFGDAPYTRGGLTLGALRATVGDDAFFTILKQWAARKKDSTGTTPEFIALAQEISGKQLGQLFHDWLYGTTKPPLPVA